MNPVWGGKPVRAWTPDPPAATPDQQSRCAIATWRLACQTGLGRRPLH